MISRLVDLTHLTNFSATEGEQLLVTFYRRISAILSLSAVLRRLDPNVRSVVQIQTDHGCIRVSVYNVQIYDKILRMNNHFKAV